MEGGGCVVVSWAFKREGMELMQVMLLLMLLLLLVVVLMLQLVLMILRTLLLRSRSLIEVAYYRYLLRLKFQNELYNTLTRTIHHSNTISTTHKAPNQLFLKHSTKQRATQH